MHDAECFLEYPAPQLPRGGKGPGGKNNTGIVSNKVFLQFSRDGGPGWQVIVSAGTAFLLFFSLKQHAVNETSYTGNKC
jgi:hypothetical protein